MFGVLNAILLQIGQNEGMNSLNLRGSFDFLIGNVSYEDIFDSNSQGLANIVFIAINPCG